MRGGRFCSVFICEALSISKTEHALAKQLAKSSLARVRLEAFAEQVISYDNETLSEVINVNTDKIIY